MTTRPHLLITADPVEGLRHIDDVHRVARTPLGKPLWDELIAKAEAAIDAEPLTPWSFIPGRHEADRANGNREFGIVSAATGRVCACALAHLLTDKRAYLDAALRQADCVFDAQQWPDWIDQAHMGRGLFADLRHGQFTRDLGLAYDWLYPAMSEAQRRGFRNGLRGRGMQAVYDGIANKNHWADGTNNWMTVIVGGLGVAAMALAPDEPDVLDWLELTVPRMQGYLEHLGPEGEFNENPGYASSVHFVLEYFDAYRYHTGNRVNLLGDKRFNAFGHWLAQMTLSQGAVAPFGDCPKAKSPAPVLFAALADAANDQVLQWYFQQLVASGQQGYARPEISLLAINPDLPATSPTDAGWPRSHSFPGQGKIVYSRTDWDLLAPQSLVISKARHGWEMEDGPFQGFLHHDFDAGNVVIEAYGEKLILDIYHMGYAKDFFNAETRPRYYCKGTLGHNVPMIGRRNALLHYKPFTRLTHHQAFDHGAWWKMDLTSTYEGAAQVHRTVVHLYPDIIAVLDDIQLKEPEEISLRWHTIDRCAPGEDGSFTVASAGVHLAGRMLRLDEGPLDVQRREHAYQAPYDRHRNGALFEQPHESYIEAITTGTRARVLSVFAAFGSGPAPQRWTNEEEGQSVHIQSPLGDVSVCVGAHGLTLVGPRSRIVAND